MTIESSLSSRHVVYCSMPYIKQSDRDLLAQEFGWSPSTPGDLNYKITLLIQRYWREGQSYQTINDIIGALEGAKAEFQRRVVAPYEDSKIKENGDVY